MVGRSAQRLINGDKQLGRSYGLTTSDEHHANRLLDRPIWKPAVVPDGVNDEVEVRCLTRLIVFDTARIDHDTYTIRRHLPDLPDRHQRRITGHLIDPTTSR